MKSSRNTESVSDASSNSRRRLLAGGVFAGITAPFIPIKWTQPVVKAVLLPAHAQTSPSAPVQTSVSGPEQPPCLSTDVIPGVTLRCGAEEFCVAYQYELQDGCLVREEIGCGTGLPGPGELRVEFLKLGVDSGDMVLFIRVFSASDRVVQICDPAVDPFFPLSGVPIRRPMVVSGADYAAAFSIGRTEDPPTVFVSDITVAPA